MWEAARAVAFVLATMVVSPLAAEPYQAAGAGYNHTAGLTEGHIAQAKAALRLTPAQERHWPRISAALRALGQRKGKSAGVVGVVAAATPLLRTLNAEQKETVKAMVKSMGYGHLASRF